MTVPDPYLTPGDRGDEPWRAPRGDGTSAITPTPATPAPEYTGPTDHTRPTSSLPPYAPGGGTAYGQQPWGSPAPGGPNPYGAPGGATAGYGSGYPTYGAATTNGPGPAYPGGATPYGGGYPGGYGPAYATPYGAPGGPPRSNGMAVGALATGLASLIVLVLATVGIGGVLGGLVGIGLGIGGLRRARAGAPGRGQAIGGIVTSVLAIIAGGLFFVAVFGDLGDAWDEGWERAERDAAAPAEPDDAPARPDSADYEAGWSDGWDEGYAAASGGTPVDAPSATDPALERHLLNEPGRVGRFEIVVTSIDVEADQVVMDAFGDNPAPMGGYVLVTMTATNVSDVPARPYADLSTSYWGSDDLLYNEWSCQAWPARPAVEAGILQPGESAEYEVCVDVPHAALGDAAEAAVLIEDFRGPAYDVVRWSAS